jgi:type I restriction enzyme S subunit
MISEWLNTTLGAICDRQGGSIQTGPFGNQLHTSDYKEVGIPVVMPTNIGDSGIVEERISRIGQSDVDRLSQHVLRLGDIVFSRRGDVTKNALVRNREVGWFCGTGCLKVRLGTESIASAKFISHCLRLPDTKDWLVRHAVGATMPNLNTGILSAVPIHLPPLKDQHEMAGILDALDDRIALLRETNATLEAIAQALFKSWFVDFDPVYAKQQGIAPAGMDDATAALFPDGFEDSEFWPMPKGWSVSTVESIAERVGMGPFGSNIKVETFVPNGVPVISGQHLKQALVEDNTFNFISAEHAERLSKSCVQHGDVIFTHAGSIGQVSLLHRNSAFDRYVLSQRQFFLRCNANLMQPEWMAYYFRSPQGQHQLLANTSQVGVPSIARPVSYLRSIKIIVPPISIVDRFSSIADAVHCSVMVNRNQISTLVTLRDTLLPRLISGQLRLPEAEEQLAEAIA